jgi:hypothetical protein
VLVTWRAVKIGGGMNGAGSSSGIVFDPTGLSSAQRAGAACVACRKSWPRPEQAMGALPDGTTVYACDECAPGLLTAISEARTAPAAAETGEAKGHRDSAVRHPIRALRRNRGRWPSRR